MKEVSYFLADDGTQFEEMEDCIRYEFKKELCHLVENGLTVNAYDENGDELALFKEDVGEEADEGTIESDFFNNAKYVRIDTDEIAMLMARYANEEFGIDFPESSGDWYYDELSCEWKDFDALEAEVDRIRYILS